MRQAIVISGCSIRANFLHFSYSQKFLRCTSITDKCTGSSYIIQLRKAQYVKGIWGSQCVVVAVTVFYSISHVYILSCSPLLPEGRQCCFTAKSSFLFLPCSKAVFESKHTAMFLFWKVPMRMTKVHILLNHVVHFVKFTRHWGLFSEECFEHYQQTAKYLRNRHSGNSSAGSQLCSDLHYSWIRSLPKIQALQQESDEIARKNHPRSKKRRKQSVT